MNTTTCTIQITDRHYGPWDAVTCDCGWTGDAEEIIDGRHPAVVVDEQDDDFGR